MIPPSQRLPHPSECYYYFEREGSVWSNDIYHDGRQPTAGRSRPYTEPQLQHFAIHPLRAKHNIHQPETDRDLVEVSATHRHSHAREQQQHGEQQSPSEQQRHSGYPPLSVQQPPPAGNIDLSPGAGDAGRPLVPGTGEVTPARQQDGGGALVVTPAVTRRAASATRGLRSLVTEPALPELRQLSLYTSADLSDMAHKQETPVPSITLSSKRVPSGKRNRVSFRTPLRSRESCQTLLYGSNRTKKARSRVIKHQVYEFVRLTVVPAR